MKSQIPTTPVDQFYQADFFSNPGTDPRKDQHNEDRADCRAIMTRSGLKLFVGVVCDGVGGRNKGEVASVTAMENFLGALQNSAQPTVPQAIREAADIANSAVLQKGQHSDGRMGCTLAAAIIHKDDSPWGRLYVANMGDSRVGLIRNQKLIWLSREHNVYTDSILQGMPPEQAARLPNADHITRAMGAKAYADVDIGIYYQINSPLQAEREAESLGMMGLPLEEGDTIICCSDGITEINPANNKPYLPEEEMVRVALHDSVKNAVLTLRGYANGREPRDDNTLVMIFVAPYSKKRRPVVGGNRKSLYTTIGVMGVITVLLFMAFLSSNQSAAENAQELTRVALEVTQTLAQETAIVLSYTPTPSPTPTFTPTPFKTLAPGQWGIRYHFSINSTSPLQENIGILQVAQPEKIDIYYPQNYQAPAHFYVQSNSRIHFTGVGSSIRLKFLQGDMFIYTGHYNSVITELEFTPGIEFSVTGSCMALQYDQLTNAVSVWCFEGSCAYHNNFSQQSSPIARGMRVVWAFDPATRQLIQNRSELISPIDAARYDAIIKAADGFSMSQSQLCIATYMPTPTPTMTPTRLFIATPTPLTIQAPIIIPSLPPNQSNQSNPPVIVPSLTNTPTASPTNTPTASPTNTPVSPTPDTPVPPPDTPVPPPDTPVLPPETTPESP